MCIMLVILSCTDLCSINVLASSPPPSPQILFAHAIVWITSSSEAADWTDRVMWQWQLHKVGKQHRLSSLIYSYKVLSCLTEHSWCCRFISFNSENHFSKGTFEDFIVFFYLVCSVCSSTTVVTVSTVTRTVLVVNVNVTPEPIPFICCCFPRSVNISNTGEQRQ